MEIFQGHARYMLLSVQQGTDEGCLRMLPGRNRSVNKGTQMREQQNVVYKLDNKIYNIRSNTNLIYIVSTFPLPKRPNSDTLNLNCLMQKKN